MTGKSIKWPASGKRARWLKVIFGKSPAEYPTIQDIRAIFGQSYIKATFEDTIESIWNDEEARAFLLTDSVEFHDDIDGHARLIKDLVNKWASKAEATKFSLPLVSEIDAVWRAMEFQQMTEPLEVKIGNKKIGEHWVTFIPSGKDLPPEERKVYVMERLKGTGSFKAVFSATAFYAAKTENEREDLAIAIAKELAGPYMQEGESSLKRMNTDDKKKAETGIALEGKLALDFAKRFKYIWPTLEVIEVRGITRIIQKNASYKASFINLAGEEEEFHASNFEQMGKKVLDRSLTIPSQIALLDMIEDGLKSVKDLHDGGYIHRDIKPANFLCGKEGMGD